MKQKKLNKIQYNNNNYINCVFAKKKEKMLEFKH